MKFFDPNSPVGDDHCLDRSISDFAKLTANFFGLFNILICVDNYDAFFPFTMLGLASPYPYAR